jgi:hypothetical protein
MKAIVQAAALGLALLAGSARGEPAPVLKMDAQTQVRLGVATAALQAARRSASVSGFARALDAGPLAQLDSDIATAVAAAAASQAEAARTKRLNLLDETVSKQAAEAAQAQARGDAAKLLLLRRRLGLEWGSSLARLPDARRTRLVADIAAGRAALVRIDAAQGLGQARGSAEIDLGVAGRARATILGPARVGDPRLQSTGALALVTGRAALQFGAGTVAPAVIGAGPDTAGVLIPRAALLRSGGQTFVYIRRDATDFERRALSGALSDPAGLFAPTGFRPGEAVVVSGASQLFAAQTAPAKGEVD